MIKILIGLIVLLFSPVIVNADVDYEITDYYIESHILDNGDLKVKELFVLDGYFNGYERDIFMGAYLQSDPSEAQTDYPIIKDVFFFTLKTTAFIDCSPCE